MSEVAEQQAQQVMVSITRGMITMTLRVAQRASGKVASKATNLAGGIVKGAGRGGLKGVSWAVGHLGDAATQLTKGSLGMGTTTLKTFGKTSMGTREVVALDDVKLAKVAARQMRRYGVTFAVEKTPDGGRAFHVQGKDAATISQALGTAERKLDKVALRNASRAQVGARLRQSVAAKRASTPARSLDKTISQHRPRGAR